LLQRVRQAEPASHLRHQVSRVGNGHSGRRDIQRPGRLPAADRDGVRRRPERALRHANDRDTELGMDVCPQAEAACRIEVNVTINYDQREPARGRNDGAQRRQFTQVEFPRLIGGITLGV
jgi:hypothetical protein